MTRAETLRALADRVEACPLGRLHKMDEAAAQITSEVMRDVTYLCIGVEGSHAGIWPRLDGFGSHPMDSLDACAALHKAVLGERWSVDRIEQWPDQGEWVVCLASASREIGAQGARASTEARARLSAILRALAEEEGRG